MFTHLKQMTWLPVISIALGGVSHSEAVAKKPPSDDSGELQFVELEPSGDQYAAAYAINDAGIVVGSVDRVPGYWNAREAVPTFVPLLGHGEGAAYSINENGEIAGWEQWPPSPTYWPSPSHAPVPLPMPPNAERGWASGVAQDGVVVGEVWDDDTGTCWAVAWRITDSGVFGPVFLSVGGANDVACIAPELHLAVGRSADVDYGHVATAWDLITEDDGTFTVFGSTLLVPDSTGEAFAVTERGDVTGIVKYVNAAFVIRNGSVTLLPSGPRNEYGVGYDLNDSEVVGKTGRSWLSENMTAIQWNSRNKRQDLVGEYFGDGWPNTSAEGINAAGEMVGYGTTGAWLLRRQ
jgi:uncharacterized membrane protein